MERRMRTLWWGVLGIMLLLAGWKFVLPHKTTASVQKTANNREIVVYVSGAVSKPGLVNLPLDARLNDALKAAGPLPEANLELLNPAEKLKDGQKITIPYKAGMNPAEAAAPMNPTAQPSPTPQSSTSHSSQSQTASSQPPSSPMTPSSSSPKSGSGKININTAGIAELDQLPGVGPALAERIIQYRTDHGPFAKPEDLQEVSGIGPKTYEKMASLVTTGP